MTGVFWGASIAVGLLLLYIIIYMLGKGLSVISWDFDHQSMTPPATTSRPRSSTPSTWWSSLLICIPIAFSAATTWSSMPGKASSPRPALRRRYPGRRPSIILGLFGFLVSSPFLELAVFIGLLRLAGALTLVMLNLPLLLRVSEDALRAVPNELREASASLE